MMKFCDCRDVHGGRKAAPSLLSGSMHKDKHARIVTTLTLINMIVRVYRLLGTKFSAKDLNGTIRNYLSETVTVLEELKKRILNLLR
jgi:hypothetical protein